MARDQSQWKTYVEETVIPVYVHVQICVNKFHTTAAIGYCVLNSASTPGRWSQRKGFNNSIVWASFIIKGSINQLVTNSAHEFIMIIVSLFRQQAEKKTGPIPWGHFARCVPLWAILVTQCGMSWMFYTQLTELPSYMNNILHMNLERVSYHSEQSATILNTVKPSYHGCASRFH